MIKTCLFPFPPRNVSLWLLRGCTHKQTKMPPSISAEENSEPAMKPTVPMVWREDVGKSMQVPMYYASCKPSRSISREELAQHNTEHDCWVVIHGRVYDCSKFIKVHPGGWLPMQQLAGKPDCTDAFEAFHPARVHEKLLPGMFVGEFADAAPVSDFVLRMRAIHQTLLQEDRFDTHFTFYIRKFVWIFSLFGLALALTLQSSGSVAVEMLGALVMGLFWQQLAFIGHDIGHNALSHIRTRDLFNGIVFGDALMGISLGWWKHSHNVHHVVCNSVEHDPDIQHMPFLAVSEKITRAPYKSTYHNKMFSLDWFASAFVPFQHFLFYPIMMLARGNLYLQSYKFLLTEKRVQYRFWELGAMLFFAAWVTGVAMQTQVPWAWVLVSHAASGILHVQICLSHFPLDVYLVEDGVEWDWYTQQLSTCLNVATSVDWFHGGLQFQTEHHLWPRLPRHQLRHARFLVRETLQSMDKLDMYNEKSFLRGNLFLLSVLKQSASTAGQRGKFSSLFQQGLNLEG